MGWDFCFFLTQRILIENIPILKRIKAEFIKIWSGNMGNSNLRYIVTANWYMTPLLWHLMQTTWNKLKSLFPNQARNHSNICRFVYNRNFNHPHRENSVIQYNSLNQHKNGCLAASDLFHMFTQWIKLFSFYYYVLKSTDVWKMWFII